MLWIGYWRGLYRVDPSRNNIPYFATGTAVGTIYADKFGVLWYGTDEGLVRKDAHALTEQHFVHDPHKPHSLRNNRVDAIYEDEAGELWIGTEKGLDCFNRKTASFFHYKFFPDKDNSVIGNEAGSSVLEDSHGYFWLGIQDGLIRINRQYHTIIRHYVHDPHDTNSISKGAVNLIYEDKSGYLWLATFGGTLNRLSPQTGRVQRFLNGTNIHSIWQDAEGIIWVGTSIGLYRSNIALNGFTRFNAPNGELSGNMIVNGVMEDDQKNLWISASAGICRINKKRNTIVIFSRYNDPAWYNGSCTYKDKNSKLYFGGSGGYFAFLPEQLTGNTKPPQIVINDFRLADQLVAIGKQSPLKQPLAQTTEIHLNHDQNVFSFSFAGIHYSNPEKNPHLFMLEGLDNTWRKASEDKIAYYSNVAPGHYFFRVKAANSDGVWAEKSIAVFIAMPWWRTWWAYLLYLSGFAAMLFLFNWYRSRNLRAENLVLEERMIKRTCELEQSLKEKYELSKKVESQRALLNERLRISRELHDDFGSTLGSISIYSEVAKKRTEKNENANEVLSKIGIASRELIDKMSDIVWSLKPGNESFQQLQKRMMAFAAIMFTPLNTQYDFIACKELKRLQFSGEQCKNIFLIFKEALYNIVKYAECKTAWITLSVQNNNLLMIIQDDGNGFDINKTISKKILVEGKYSGGNGIKNMQARAEHIKAKLCIHSKINEGTTIQLTLPLRNSSKSQLPNMVIDIPAKK